MVLLFKLLAKNNAMEAIFRSHKIACFVENSYFDQVHLDTFKCPYFMYLMVFIKFIV